ncbi:UDP-galactose:fucoside alpha-3-galactosyltransferase-like isoform X1 [Patiria miniata]|uniref:Nucleotide-diphospho-sugar transferase domain-containing protein n=1 Tax=Patiria miniata TaxID=46514 RepID=A0A914BC54_PATMI|nr:UDP-galactose:fucoside alpha-3-galactosyltransferase-like isoform X1 [Patiria miniata]XP_038073624.1 UDP-galactose:fucoside alpha-3-galactosyltransferase-like isoform X1 [Patiria miniata]
MATEHAYKVLFFMQSAAFILFIINYFQMSTVVVTPVGRLSAKKTCDCKPIGTREVFNISTYVCPNGQPPMQVRGQLSNCTLADIKKRPGVVMLTTANLAYADVALNMLESVKRIGVCVNTTVIAEDQKAYDLLLKYAKGDPAIYVQKTNSGEMDAIEPSRRLGSHYYGIMNKRQAYILTLLEQGLEVLFSDSDTFWFRDPFPYFQGDFDISLRGFTKTRIVSKTNFCAGFIYLKPTKATIQFVRTWVELMDNNKKKGSFTPDQTVMNGLLRADKPGHVNVRMLDADLFPWGPTFFDPSWQKQNHSTVVMHAASIRGHPAKLSKFNEFGMWLVNVTTSPGS